MKDLCLAVTKVFTVGHGRRTIMTAMAIYEKKKKKKKKKLKIFFRTLSQMTFKLSTQQEGLEPSRISDYNTVPQM